MKNDKTIRAVLDLYTIDDAPSGSMESAKAAVLAADIPKTVPRFSLFRFLRSQLRALRASFWIFSAAYVVLIASICSFSDSASSVISLCAATPFLVISAVPSLFYNSNPMSLELEASCLYRPKAVLAGKTVLCGFFSLLCVIACGIICAVFGRAELEISLLFGLISFTASAVVTLAACVLFRTRTGLLITIGLFCAVSGILFINSDVQAFILSLEFNRLAPALAVLALLLIPTFTFTFEKYDYERLCNKIEY